MNVKKGTFPPTKTRPGPSNRIPEKGFYSGPGAPKAALWQARGRGAPLERVFIRCSSPFVFHRYPQVHCERFRCKGANLCDHVFDRSRCQAMSTERSESATVGNRSQ